MKNCVKCELHGYYAEYNNGHKNSCQYRTCLCEGCQDHDMLLELLSRERVRRKEAREKWSGDLSFQQLLMRGIKEEVSEEFVGGNQFHSIIPLGAVKQELEDGFVNFHKCTATLNIKKEPIDSNEAALMNVTSSEFSHSVENHLLSFPTPGRTDDEDTEDERIAVEDLMGNVADKPMNNLEEKNSDINGLGESKRDTHIICEIEENSPNGHSQKTHDSSKLEVEINNNAEGISGTFHNFGIEVECSTSDNIISGNDVERLGEESSGEIVVGKVNEILNHFVTTHKNDEALDDDSVVPIKKAEVKEFGITGLKESRSGTHVICEIGEMSPDGQTQNTGNSSKCEIEFKNNTVGTFVEEVEHSEESKSEMVVDVVKELLKPSSAANITSSYKKEGKVKRNLSTSVRASKRYAGNKKMGEALRPPFFGPPLRWMIPVPMHMRGEVTGPGGFYTNMIQRLTGTWISWDSQHCIVEGGRAGVARASSMIQSRICRINYFGPPLRWMIPVPMHLRGQVSGSGGCYTNMIQRLTGTWITWDSQHCIVEGSRAGVARASCMIRSRICRIN